MSGDGSPHGTEPFSNGRAWVAIALLGCSLAVLTISPVVVSMRTRVLRSEITEVAEPTIAAASGIERALGLQLAALRGLALTGDSAFLREYHRQHDRELEFTRRLTELAGSLDTEVVRQSERLASMATEWHETVGSLTAAADGQALERLVTRGAVPSLLLGEARSIRRSVESIERLRRAEIAAVERVEIWVNTTMVLLATAAGVSLVVLGRRLRALGAEAEWRRIELQRSVERRARLMRGISHDLKNPLGVAGAHVEFLETEMKGPVTTGQKASLDAVRRSLETTVRLVDDLLHLARAERGALSVNHSSVDFSELIAEVADEARPQADAKDLVLAVEPTRRSLRGTTDPDRVREILLNLVSNAIRYTPSGGRVSMRVEEVEPGAVRLSVSDTGPGIAPVDQERVFEEFERIGGGTEGSGLGLAISRHIAHILGGEIELESEVGKGSTFSLRLPI